MENTKNLFDFIGFADYIGLLHNRVKHEKVQDGNKNEQNMKINMKYVYLLLLSNNGKCKEDYCLHSDKT